MDYIAAIQNLNLKNSDYFDYCKIIEQIPVNQILAFKVEKDTDILRVRPSEDKPFNHSTQLSYNPNVRNYGRAHRPYLPMFYGAVKTQKDEYPIITNFSEINEILRKKSKAKGEQNLTIGIWRVVKEFLAVLLIFNEDYYAKMPQFHKLYKDFVSDKNNSFETEVLSFFSKEYAKDNIVENYEYKLTAAFTEVFAMKSNVGAIIYPSVRLGGETFNIAIRPEYIDSDCLELRAVLETKIYYEKGCVVNDYLRETETIFDDGSFELKEIKDQSKHHGREKSLLILNELLKRKKPYSL